MEVVYKGHTTPYLTEFKIYKVLEEDSYCYTIIDDSGHRCRYKKDRFKKAEERVMSKEYTFSEMIKEYENGYTGQFKRLDTLEETLVYKNTSGFINWKSGSTVMLNTYALDGKYVKVDREVPVHEAIKALKEGKEVLCKLTQGQFRYKSAILCETIQIIEIMNGKWYIVE